MDTNSPDPAAALRRVGLRVTVSRLAMLTAPSASAPHPSVDALVRAARVRLGNGLAQTVYNARRTFIDVGLMHRIEPAGQSGLYELRDGDNHHHIACHRPGTIADAGSTVADDSDYEIEEAEVLYWDRRHEDGCGVFCLVRRKVDTWRTIPAG